MTENKIPYKIYLEESEMPTAWYNVRADMPTKPAPLLNPATGEPMAAYSVVARFLELGGEIVTMGSDAHDPSRVGDRFSEVQERLRTLGLRYICTFSQMEPEFHRL